jgi:MFS family permease
MIGSAVFAVGCILEIAAAGQLALFCVGRVVAGLGVGFISNVIILYMSEIAPKKVRGALVAGQSPFDLESLHSMLTFA